MAATVIDAFLVTLGLDGSQFRSGMRDVDREQQRVDDAQKRRDQAERRRQQERERAQRQTVDGYRKVRNEVLTLAAIFTAGVGIKDFVTNTINSAVNLGYLSANLSMSTERIKAFQLASERAGGTQEGLTAQLKESVDTLAELNTGGGPNAGLQAFFRWGGSSKDLKDGNTYLMARAKIVQELFAQDPGRAALIAKQMGISEDQFNFIKQGPDAIEELIRAQEKHAAVTAKDAAAALKLRNQVLDLRDSLTQTATRIVLQLAPALERLFAKLEKGGQWVSDHQDDIARWVDTSITAISELVRWVDSAAESLGGWKNILIGIVAIKLAGTVASLVTMAAALAKIGGASAAGSVLGKLGAVGAAGAVGYGVGTLIDSVLPESVRDVIGEGVARTLASFGNREAGEAVNRNTGKVQYEFAPEKAAPAAPPPKDAQGRLKALEAQYGLPGGVLDKMWLAESSRGVNMMSPAGAEGHFGFMPRTAKEYGLTDPNDFDQSSDAAARKMRDLLKMYGGDIQKALAAYNWGNGNLDRKGMANAPKETRDYVAKIAGTMNSAAAPAANAPTRSMGGTMTSEVNIENLNVNTQAKDAEGIARSIKPAVERYSFPNNANTGMVQ